MSPLLIVVALLAVSPTLFVVSLLVGWAARRVRFWRAHRRMLKLLDEYTGKTRVGL